MVSLLGLNALRMVCFFSFFPGVNQCLHTVNGVCGCTIHSRFWDSKTTMRISHLISIFKSQFGTVMNLLLAYTMLQVVDIDIVLVDY